MGSASRVSATPETASVVTVVAPAAFRRPPCCDDRLSAGVVTMTLMSELPAGDTHDVIRRGGEVVAVVVPIAEYQQLRQAAQEQQVNAEFDAARAEYLARREAGTIRYLSHEEAGRRLGLSSR
jgi:hypothetical protein